MSQPVTPQSALDARWGGRTAVDALELNEATAPETQPVEPPASPAEEIT